MSSTAHADNDHMSVATWDNDRISFTHVLRLRRYTLIMYLSLARVLSGSCRREITASLQVCTWNVKYRWYTRNCARLSEASLLVNISYTSPVEDIWWLSYRSTTFVLNSIKVAIMVMLSYLLAHPTPTWWHHCCLSLMKSLLHLLYIFYFWAP